MITKVKEWQKDVCIRRNCKYYIHRDYPECSYCSCPDNYRCLKYEAESDGMKRKHGDILDKIRLEMVKSARLIVSEYNKIEDGMSLRKILQIIDYWHNTESEVEKCV